MRRECTGQMCVCLKSLFGVWEGGDCSTAGVVGIAGVGMVDWLGEGVFGYGGF